MGEWECAMCGYAHLSDEAPEVCPDCGATKAQFVYYPFDEDEWATAEALNALRALAQLNLTDESELETT